MGQICRHCKMTFETDVQEYFCEDCRFLKNEKGRQKKRVIYHKRELEKHEKRLSIVEHQLSERKKMLGENEDD